ncbi:Acetyltransferase (GNAT) family protein [compost metagenome]
MNIITIDQEEQYIINNLYEFWSFVGKQSCKILTNQNYQAIMLSDSDWPKKIFRLGDGKNLESDVIQEIVQAIKLHKLPNAITLTETISTNYKEQLKVEGFVNAFKQQGMIVKLSDSVISEKISGNYQFKLVETNNDANLFASIASQSFKYKVDGAIVASLLNNNEKVQLFIGYDENEPAFCGLIFYDSEGYAGLHMIGTLPQFRGRGLATVMTNRLLKECMEDHKQFCVLHASAAGEPIYTKLGFKRIKEVITYSLGL